MPITARSGPSEFRSYEALVKLSVNEFKRRLAGGEPLVGMWCSLPGGFAAEVLAGAGFDWILFDTEHSPGDPVTVLSQLQTAAAYPVSSVVRPASNDPVLIKRLLDIGAQTLLVPFVENAAEAAQAVAAMRYPPLGMRGVAGITRASRFGRVKNYGALAADELCLLVQVETRTALADLEAIASVDGVDGVFIGPSDLAASLGHIGRPDHPEVVALIEDALRRLRALGKPSGLLTTNVEFARRSFDLGAAFVAVGVDVALLTRAADELASLFAPGRQHR